MSLALVNIVTTVLLLWALWSAVHIYFVVRAGATLLLTAALCYITGVRIAVSVTQYVDTEGWIPSHTSFLLAPFYGLLALALYFLLRSLRRFAVKNGRL